MFPKFLHLSSLPLLITVTASQPPEPWLLHGFLPNALANYPSRYSQDLLANYKELQHVCSTERVEGDGAES